MSKAWWKQAVVYQIYPRSFMDSNQDGIGDLGGIRAKLHYLHQLGVDVLWLCPIYESPNDDNGYDISDYQAILREFGTMEEFDALLHDAHALGLKIMMDLVVNHTSDEHPWFQNARSSRTNAYRDYYIWRDRPNDWTSVFTGSAWEFEEQTAQYFLHLFSKKQPDLNWENPDVRREVYNLMRFWLDKGIDGFRMDVINLISKALKSDNAAGSFKGSGVSEEYYVNGPRIHEFLREMNHEVLAHYDIMTVGETPGVNPAEALLYTGTDRRELNMIFQFDHVELDSGPHGKWDLVPWSLSDLKQVMTMWQDGLYNRGWNSLYLNNHDQPRMVSRFGDDTNYRVESAKMLATFLHMLQGTPYIYQGEEIGMTNVAFESIEAYKDLETLNMWNEQVVQGNADANQVLQAVYAKGRDNARTPMQWDDSPHGGFTTGEPWIAVNSNYTEINVEKATANPDSIFYYYQRLIQLRKQYDVITDGRYELILESHEEIYAYLRTLESETLLVVCNFYEGSPEFQLPESISSHFQGESELLISNYAVDDAADINNFKLRPYESRVYCLKKE
ncbi:alpha-glucosidase [Alicyclobacillus sp. SO9]|uniref:glycoside hydrolase family 13 protein n=1 Tax=Alicyclobacillus sp. SO9 TaxID=2665646 RepID=UPI0018E85636|nr:alpha-glucosidase [Alicyclobacillus sp. SO9]QQE78723.1 alpha-glucosidase [Alicyclobacillus sp. SO9]